MMKKILLHRLHAATHLHRLMHGPIREMSGARVRSSGETVSASYPDSSRHTASIVREIHGEAEAGSHPPAVWSLRRSPACADLRLQLLRQLFIRIERQHPRAQTFIDRGVFLRCKSFHTSVKTLAPNDLAISTVRSVEPESTTTISSAKRTLASVRARFSSSFSVMIATESVDRGIPCLFYLPSSPQQNL